MIRFYFTPCRKPWYWFFTWWRQKWVNYGAYTPVLIGQPGYDDAPYELGYQMDGPLQERKK